MTDEGSELDDLVQLTPTLASLGWNEEHDAWAEETEADEDGIRGRLARVSRGFSLVFTGGDALLAASGSSRSELDLVPATGDFVIVRDDPEDGPSLAAIAPRSTTLQRRAAGRVPEPQVLAANAKAVFVMHGLDREMNLRRIERQLVIGWDSGATPTVILTKADTEPDVDAVVGQVEAIAPGAEVLAISTVSGRGIEQIRGFFDDNGSVALLGLSGVGKSSLVNLLSDGVVQRIGEVRAADRRGRHTTVTRDLIPLPSGGFVIDAPGVREIGLWQAYEGLSLAFPELATAAESCRFADCEHQNEPGCQVQEGIAAGTILDRRLDHWRELQAELELQETQLIDFARRSESRDRADAENQRDRARPNRRSRSRGGAGSTKALKQWALAPLPRSRSVIDNTRGEFGEVSTMRSDQSALQHPPAAPTKTAHRARPITVRARGAAALLGFAVLSLSACGRSAPVDALSDLGDDPDIAGVSVTSPDAVVATSPSVEGETTTSSTLLAPQQILYTVQPGDTLSGIAGTYNVSVQDLADYNGISDVNAIAPGMELAIPPTPIEGPDESAATEDTDEP